MTAQKYLILFGVALFASAGDSLLSRGMKEIGWISLHNLSGLILAIRDPWIILGILFLIAFFAAYMAALSWADLTYVLPATSIGYVVLALIAKFILHEQVTLLRWLGILLITAGVGFVAGGEALTSHGHHQSSPFTKSAKVGPEESEVASAVSTGAER